MEPQSDRDQPTQIMSPPFDGSVSHFDETIPTPASHPENVQSIDGSGAIDESKPEGSNLKDSESFKGYPTSSISSEDKKPDERLVYLKGKVGGLEEINSGSQEKKERPSSDLINFMQKGGPALSRTKPTETGEKKSWVEDFDLKLLQLKMDREKMRREGEQHTTLGQKEDEKIVVLDAVNFTGDIYGIHQLLNPPERLHPWLKWLLYSRRITPQMLELYYAALQKRDQIYMLATKSGGKLKIRYHGKVTDMPLFIWPDQAAGLYELVAMKNRGVGEMHQDPTLVSPAINPSSN